MRKFLSIVILSTGIGLSLQSMQPAFAGTATFTNPTVNGYGLDYCREWSQDCGKPAADTYCQQQGYDQAIDFQWIQGNQQTRVITSGQVCDGAQCDRISSVTCSRATEVFANPTVNGYGLDYCREWSQDCGKPAADAYCQQQGYDQAIDFQWIQGNQQTRVITSGQVCDGAQCDRISSVTCR